MSLRYPGNIRRKLAKLRNINRAPRIRARKKAPPLSGRRLPSTVPKKKTVARGATARTEKIFGGSAERKVAKRILAILRKEPTISKTDLTLQAVRAFRGSNVKLTAHGVSEYAAGKIFDRLIEEGLVKVSEQKA